MCEGAVIRSVGVVGKGEMKGERGRRSHEDGDDDGVERVHFLS